MIQIDVGLRRFADKKCKWPNINYSIRQKCRLKFQFQDRKADTFLKKYDIKSPLEGCIFYFSKLFLVKTETHSLLTQNQVEYSIITHYSRMINGVSHFSLDAVYSVLFIVITRLFLGFHFRFIGRLFILYLFIVTT